MIILSIDPGKKSGWAVYDGKGYVVGRANIEGRDIFCFDVTGKINVDVWKSFKIDLILIEEQFLMMDKVIYDYEGKAKTKKMNPDSYKHIIESRMIWEMTAKFNGVKRIRRIYPAEWQGILKIQGFKMDRYELKKSSKLIAATELQLKSIDDNAADAYNQLRKYVVDMRYSGGMDEKIENL